MLEQVHNMHFSEHSCTACISNLCVIVVVWILEHYPFQVQPIYYIFRMLFSCNSILILNIIKCKKFPLGPLKKYLSTWLYDSNLSTINLVIYSPLVLSNQWSNACDTTLSTLLTFFISVDIQITWGLDMISNWVYANLANHSYSNWWIPQKNISCMSVKIYFPSQSSVLILGFFFWDSVKSFSWSPIHFWIYVFEGSHLDISSRRFMS
jgi:hypothetical protein